MSETISIEPVITKRERRAFVDFAWNVYRDDPAWIPPLKAEVHALIARLAEQGVAILMISSELPEILGMSDRILVMRAGRIVADISRQEATEEAIMAAATGQTLDPAAATA